MRNLTNGKADHSEWNGFFYLILVSLLLIFFFYMIKNLNPFCHTSESVYVVGDAFFLTHNINWFPFPHLNLPCDFFAYPYKFDPVFLTWMLEHDYFSGLLLAIFGIGPWEQIYWIISLAISAIIPYILLRKYGHYENWRSAVFALLVTFCNYAVICKYPSHYTLVIYHWVVISFVMDFLVLKKYFDKERYSATFVLLKIMFLVFCLGLELGYIAGMAFCSTFLVCLYIFFCELIRSRSFVQPFRWFWEQFLYTCKDFKSSRINYFVSGLIIIALFLYLPIVLQIAIITKTGSVSDSSLIQTASWRRILLPIFPWFHPAMFMKYCLADPAYGIADTIYANCVGWSFLLIFIGGFFFSKKKFLIFLPFALLVFLIVFVIQFPLLKYFPCFSYARFNERFSPALVPLISFAILCFDKKCFYRLPLKIFLCFLIPCLALECFTAYSKTFVWIDLIPTSKCMEVIKKLQKWPGQAICFLPFSVMGGDGHYIGTPCDSSSPHKMQFAAFTKKKTNNFYGGRLDLLSGELPQMQKCRWDIFHNQLIKGTLSEQNLQEFEIFLKSADFAAIVLFDGEVHPVAKQQILKRFGHVEPVWFCGHFMHVIFLPDSFRRIQKPQKDIFFSLSYPVATSPMECLPRSGFSENWATEKEVHIILSLKVPFNDIIFSFEGFPFLHEKFPQNEMTVYINGKTLENVLFGLGKDWNNQIRIPKGFILDGDNDFMFRFKDLRSPSDFGGIDSRRLGFHFTKIRLEGLRSSVNIAMSQYSSLSGFHEAEPSGRWSCEKEVHMNFLLAKPKRDLIFSFEGFPFLHEKFSRNEMTVYINGENLKNIVFELGKAWDNRIKIPKDLIQNGKNDFMFRFKELKSPSDFNGSDPRKLGFHFTRIKILEE